MCSLKGYDICYYFDKITIEPHFCRCTDCGGGMTLDEACEVVAKHFDEEARAMREKKHVMLMEYVNEDGSEYRGED